MSSKETLNPEIQFIYHEKQIRELCALHALNNLFQQKACFTKLELDSICHTLSPNVWINPHRSLLGLGNYDINVIMKALQRKGYEAIWFDRRKDPSCLNLENICGFILNIPTEYKFGFVMLPLHRRHWITLREIGGFFYNLDSKLDRPLLIGKEPELVQYLKGQLECRDKQLFLVVSSAVEQNQSWLSTSASTSTSHNHHDLDSEDLQLCDVMFNPCQVEDDESN